MPFTESQSRNILIVNVTEEEYRRVDTLIHEGEWPLMDYPVLFPSKGGGEFATMLLAAGMGCGDSRWWHELMPQIEEMFPDRIIHTGEFKNDANEYFMDH